MRKLAFLSHDLTDRSMTHTQLKKQEAREKTSTSDARSTSESTRGELSLPFLTSVWGQFKEDKSGMVPPKDYKPLTPVAESSERAASFLLSGHLSCLRVCYRFALCLGSTLSH